MKKVILGLTLGLLTTVSINSSHANLNSKETEATLALEHLKKFFEGENKEGLPAGFEILNNQGGQSNTSKDAKQRISSQELRPFMGQIYCFQADAPHKILVSPIASDLDSAGKPLTASELFKGGTPDMTFLKSLNASGVVKVTINVKKDGKDTPMEAMAANNSFLYANQSNVSDDKKYIHQFVCIAPIQK